MIEMEPYTAEPQDMLHTLFQVFHTRQTDALIIGGVERRRRFVHKSQEGTMVVGKSVKRVDAIDKVTGRAKYADDLVDKKRTDRKNLSFDHRPWHGKIVDAQRSCQDSRCCENFNDASMCRIARFPRRDTPWSTDPHHQDVADRLLLNRHVRYYGDDVAVVIAEDEVAADQGLRALKVEYEEYPLFWMCGRP